MRTGHHSPKAARQRPEMGSPDCGCCANAEGDRRRCRSFGGMVREEKNRNYLTSRQLYPYDARVGHGGQGRKRRRPGQRRHRTAALMGERHEGGSMVAHMPGPWERCIRLRSCWECGRIHSRRAKEREL
eukprot:scaffold872_cov421-Prasinococcus_capsulatus_cf.AAC.25